MNRGWNRLGLAVAVVELAAAGNVLADSLVLRWEPSGAADVRRLHIGDGLAAPLTEERFARIEVLSTETLPAAPEDWRVISGARELREGVLRFEHRGAGGLGPVFYAARENSGVRPPVRVRDAAGLRAAVAVAGPGTTILMEPGEYPGGFSFTGVRGAAGAPVVLGAADPTQPPVIRGGANAIQLVDPEHVELRDLVLRGATGNGLNIDDGGTFDTPARHITLRRLRVQDVGPAGNRDGIKLSGVVSFRVEECVVERWGLGGSAIDMVGCHQGIILSNLFRHTEAAGMEAGSGVQAKGGTRDVVVRRNRFENAGGRAVNLGGSTGLEFFRPPLIAGEEHWEAKDIRVEGNTFLGSLSPLAFVGVDGAEVRFNTVYRPRRWAIRILQETRAEGFVACRRGRVTDNLVIFHSAQWASGGVNVGAGTDAATFQFARNWWYCLDDPARSRPTLPVSEIGGHYGTPLDLRDAEAGDLRLAPGSPAEGAGAEALPEGA